MAGGWILGVFCGDLICQFDALVLTARSVDADSWGHLIVYTTLLLLALACAFFLIDAVRSKRMPITRSVRYLIALIAISFFSQNSIFCFLLMSLALTYLTYSGVFTWLGKSRAVFNEYRRIFFFIIAFFIVSTGGLMVVEYVNQKGELALYIKGLFGKETLHDVIVSNIANLISFLFITIVLTLKQAQQADPGSETLRKKVEWIFSSGRKKTDDEIDYMYKVIKNNLIYSSQLRYYISYSEGDSFHDVKNYKISVRTIRKIENLDNSPFENHNIPYKIFTDGVITPDGVQGFLTSMSVIRKNIPDNVRISPVAIESKDVSFDQIFNIGEGEELVIDNSFWTYHECGCTFVSSLSMYTKEIIVQIINNTSDRLHFKSLVDGQPPFFLVPGGEKILQKMAPKTGYEDLFKLEIAQQSD